MKNYFIQTYDNEWVGPAEALRNKLGFELLSLHGKVYPNFPTKRLLLEKEIHNSCNLLKYLKEYNHSNILICSNYAALTLLVLQKLHILKCNILCWYGVYIHRPKMLSLVRKVLRFAMPKNSKFRIVVFSKPEIKLYAENFGLSEDYFIYVPYGEWNKDKKLLETQDEGYCFSGGYANRDFVTLVERFQNKKEPLVIAASKENTDLVQYVEQHTISDNIKIYWDIPAEEFNKLLRYSHAVIMLMKYNTGASGQIVILTALEYGKLVIASYTDVIDEYVKNNENGLVLQDKSQESVDKAIDIIYSDDKAERCRELAEEGYQHYQKTFSYEAISDYLVRQFRKIC